MIYDIKEIFYTNPLKPKYINSVHKISEKCEDKFLIIEEALYDVGAELNTNFAYDNEYPKHKVYQYPFKINKKLVTNGQFLNFIDDNAYKRPELWLDDGWRIIRENFWNTPLYWEFIDGYWMTWSLKGYQKLDLEQPVSHISYYEADAFARWSKKRLPSEFEWEIAFSKSEINKDSYFLESNLFEAFQNNDRNSCFGNLWQWTRSAYQEYPKYKRPKAALGEYNQKFMSGQIVLRGASYATAKSHYRHSYRNFFHADKRWLANGIILVEDL